MVLAARNRCQASLEHPHVIEEPSHSQNCHYIASSRCEHVQHCLRETGCFVRSHLNCGRR